MNLDVLENTVQCISTLSVVPLIEYSRLNLKKDGVTHNVYT